MSELQRRKLALALRHDFATFVQLTVGTVSGGQPYSHNWHIDAMARALSKVASGETKRLIVTLPPRYLKSICGSVALPAWLLGLDPTLKIVCISHSEDLTSKHALDCRLTMLSPWYRRAFPNTIISRDKNRELDFVTTARGGRYATSVGGPLTGRGGDVVIVDDPLKPSDAMSEVKRTAVNEWYDRVVLSRLDDKRSGALVVVAQRLHADDLPGHLLAKEDGWEHLCLPAIADVEQVVEIGLGRYYTRRKGEVLHEAREPLAVLEKLRREMGSYNFSAQYMECPVPPDGEIIKWSWFQSFEEPPIRGADDLVVQSWDTASKATELSDYSVCTTFLMHEGKFYLLDVLRERLIYPDLRRRIVEHAASFSANVVLIEDNGSGTALLDELTCDDMPTVEDIFRVVPVLDKVTRMSAQSARIESGRVYLPAWAPWLDELRVEMLQFPYGRHDDQVDSVSQFLNWATGRDRYHVAVYF